MGLTDRDSVAEFVWKWRCKVFPRKDTLTTRVDSLDDDDIGKGKSVLETEKPQKAASTVAGNGKDQTFGADAIAKILYEGPNSHGLNFEWVDYPPKQLSKSAARAHDRVAIRVYKIKDRSKPCIAGRYPLKYHSVEVQNPALLAALAPILEKENVLLDVNETFTFKEPFNALWFCQDDIMSLHRKTGNTDPLKAYLKLLIAAMDDMFGEMRIKKKNLLASGLVDFKSAWTLFPRGTTVYGFGMNSEFLCKVNGAAYVVAMGSNALHINAKILRFNGKEFVWYDDTLTIDHFEGNKPITELEHYPLSFHKEANVVKSRLHARGCKVLDLQGLQYQCYSGIAIHVVGKSKMEKHNVDGRILIDVVGYNKYHLTLGKRENEDPEVKRNAAGWGKCIDINDIEDYPDSDLDDEDQARQNAAVKKKKEVQDVGKTKEDMLAQHHDICFIAGLLGGFALKNKLWVQFHVEDIEPIVWNDTAFSHLVYDDQQKDLVLSFVQNHYSYRSTMLAASESSSASTSTCRPSIAAPTDDVIMGKGQGLIILLSGPPGTGKTLTAEAVADRTHRPLFYLQAEDLGTNAAILGANIKRVFEMATEWDAVILLDEADVFMAERNPNDIHRNELVSIFLRELEYFRGIIFLTTNLYSTIDTAFRSRVSLHLLFNSLSKEARETVWRKFLQRLPQRIQVEELLEDVPTTEGEGKGESSSENETLSDDDIHQLALWQLNGREIKNAVRMVRTWCDHKNYAMTLSRLESGIRVTSPHATKEGDIDEELYN